MRPACAAASATGVAEERTIRLASRDGTSDTRTPLGRLADSSAASASAHEAHGGCACPGPDTATRISARGARGMSTMRTPARGAGAGRGRSASARPCHEPKRSSTSANTFSGDTSPATVSTARSGRQ